MKEYDSASKIFFGNLIDDADDVVMYGSQFSTVMVSSICLVFISRWWNPYVMHMIGKKLSILCQK